MQNKILVLEKNEMYALKLGNMLKQMLNHEVVHVNAELAVVRELTTNFFDLIVLGIHKDRAKEGLRLIEILLVEKKVVTSAPIMVISDHQDPKYVQHCIKVGVTDYLIYPEDPVEILPRLQKVLAKSSGFSEMLVRVSTTFLGPAARVFLDHQAKQKFNVPSINELPREKLPEFVHHLAVVIKPILKEKVVQFIRRLEQVFNIQRQP